LPVVRTWSLEFELVTLAVIRLRGALDALEANIASGDTLSASVLAELHEATLGLIYATGTSDLTSALLAATP
jgi:hypothetical protein